uniref:EH domain-containing protein n=1 Tax=Strix occidentalis caurina TaxID=311401 RepID=A0A8D0KW41_STROC
MYALFPLSVPKDCSSFFVNVFLVFQFSTGNPLYETYYKQVDPSYTGRVGASEAALFLKKSGLSDIILGKIWDLADPEGKGYLDKQGFYVALRLVACAQNGHDVNLSSLNLTVPPPKFVSNIYT